MELIKDYLKAGGVISAVTLVDGQLFYNIGTGMKADMSICPLGEKQYKVITRYDRYESVQFESVKDLVEFAWDRCKCGCNYYAAHMMELAQKFHIGGL